MKKLYYLSTCDTCKRIMADWNLDDSYELQDIKTQAMTAEQVDQMIALSGSAESIFSKRSRQWSARGLGQKDLSEKEYRALIIEEYTFLKRPVLIIGDQIFVGNSKQVVHSAKEAIAKA